MSSGGASPVLPCSPKAGSEPAGELPAPVTRAHVLAWVSAYGEAWSSQDADRIARLYTEDAVYVERPYDPEGGVYRGHAGIREYWHTHISQREKDIQFRQFEEDLVFDQETGTATAKWEAHLSVLTRSNAWRGVTFLQVAMLRFAADGRVSRFEEWWHARHLQRAAKGLRDPKARRPRAGPKRRVPDLGGRTCAQSALLGASLGPFDRDAMRTARGSARRQTPAAAAAEAPEDEAATPAVGEGRQAEALARDAVGRLQGRQRARDHVDRRGHAPSDGASAGALPPPRGADLVDWYKHAVVKAELVENSDVSGAVLMRPWGAFIWEELRRCVDAELDRLGVMPFRPPVLAYHADGDAADCSGERSRSFCEVRTSSEVLLYKAMAKHWVQSHRDLPLILKCWGVAVNPEPVRQPLPFLRSRELPWQEGHAAHASIPEAGAFAKSVENVYARVCEDVLAVVPQVREMPATVGVVSGNSAGMLPEDPRLSDAVPGKVVIEVPVPVQVRGASADAAWDMSGVVEIASVHRLGYLSAAAFNLSFDACDSHGRRVKRTPAQTSFSLTCRALAAAISVHGDDRGLVLPPRLAPVQVVLIPVFRTPGRKIGCREADQGGVDGELQRWCEAAAAMLQASDGGGAALLGGWAAGCVRVRIDGRPNVAPAKKIQTWKPRGAPLLLFIHLGSSLSDAEVGKEGEVAEHAELRPAVVHVMARDSDTSRPVPGVLLPAEVANLARGELVGLHNRLLNRHRAATAPMAAGATNEAGSPSG